MFSSNSNEYFGPELLEVFNAIENGVFGSKEELKGLIDTIRLKNDYYLIGADF